MISEVGAPYGSDDAASGYAGEGPVCSGAIASGSAPAELYGSVAAV